MTSRLTGLMSSVAHSPWTAVQDRGSTQESNHRDSRRDKYRSDDRYNVLLNYIRHLL